MTCPALAIYRRTDLEFVAMVYALLVDHADPAELQLRLRETYPLAVVRPRVISSESSALWYVYRDGRWNPDPPPVGPAPA